MDQIKKAKVSFASDYIAGAHPKVLEALCKTNLEALTGYTTDIYCDSAKEKIKILQDCKHSLISEFLAYWEGEKFSCRGVQHGIESIKIPDYDCIMFEDKIEYLEKEIAKLIKKVRQGKE